MTEVVNISLNEKENRDIIFFVDIRIVNPFVNVSVSQFHDNQAVLLVDEGKHVYGLM